MIKIVSWNLLYRQGAAATDIARVIEQEKPDLFLLQEATGGIGVLPAHVGGAFYTQPWKGKTYALGVWSKKTPLSPFGLKLPFSRVPGKFPPRVAQVIPLEGFTLVNVHLSHGQLLNRKQLREIARKIEGPLAIIGDFNAVGPIIMAGFEDVGPRRITHMAKKIVPFRLDRCLVRDVNCRNVKVLKRGQSDHRPIVLTLTPANNTGLSL